MAPDFRELAERKMRELNAAYEQIRESYKHRRWQVRATVNPGPTGSTEAMCQG